MGEKCWIKSPPYFLIIVRVSCLCSSNNICCKSLWSELRPCTCCSISSVALSLSWCSTRELSRSLIFNPCASTWSVSTLTCVCMWKESRDAGYFSVLKLDDKSVYHHLVSHFCKLSLAGSLQTFFISTEPLTVRIIEYQVLLCKCSFVLKYVHQCQMKHCWHWRLKEWSFVRRSVLATLQWLKHRQQVSLPVKSKSAETITAQ